LAAVAAAVVVLVALALQEAVEVQRQRPVRFANGS